MKYLNEEEGLLIDYYEMISKLEGREKNLITKVT